MRMSTCMLLMFPCRWRLHLDVCKSVDAMLASWTKEDTRAASSSGSLFHQQQQSRLQVDTQLRSRDAEGRLMVQFESPGAAQQALQMAAMVEAAAAGGTASAGFSRSSTAAAGSKVVGWWT